MKIGIVSDTHGSMEAVEKVVSLAPDVEMWLHAGDCTPDSGYLQTLVEVPVFAVAGNCDWPNDNMPDERVVEAGGHKIFLTHGHIYGVRYETDLLKQTAASRGADIAVCGHTHVALIEPGEIFVLNPGSASRPRDEARPSFMKVLLEQGQPPQAELIRMDAAEGVQESFGFF